MRRRTLFGGFALGMMMLAGLTLAGSFSAVSSRPPVPVADPVKPMEPGMLSAAQPRPKQPQPKQARPKQPQPNQPQPAQPQPKKPRPEQAVPHPARVSRVFTALARGNGADATLREIQREIQRMTRRCNDFQADLADGTPLPPAPTGRGRVTDELKLVDVTLDRLTPRIPGLSDSRARLGACLGCGWL